MNMQVETELLNHSSSCAHTSNQYRKTNLPIP